MLERGGGGVAARVLVEGRWDVAQRNISNDHVFPELTEDVLSYAVSEYGDAGPLS